MLAACSCHKPTDASAGDCSALSDALSRVHSGEQVTGIDVDPERGVQVVVEGDFKAPKVLTVEVEAGGLTQGWVPVSQLCVLADTAGVTKVRVPERASPK